MQFQLPLNDKPFVVCITGSGLTLSTQGELFQQQMAWRTHPSRKPSRSNRVGRNKELPAVYDILEGDDDFEGDILFFASDVSPILR